MDLASLPPSRFLGLCADQQLSPADSLAHVCSASALGQSTSALPCKAIGQRWCKVDRLSGDDSDCVDALDQPPTARQQVAEPETSDDDCPWQVVTRRRSGCKRRPFSVGNSVTGVKSDARVKGASLGQLPENRSAGNEVSGQHQPGQAAAPVSLLFLASCSYWPLCIKSFARLSEVDWLSFHARLRQFHQYQDLRVSKHTFQRFHQIMTTGPKAIRGTDDTAFLLSPFKVLLSGSDLTVDTVLLSLVIERIVPGFLSTLGERFVSALCGVSCKRPEMLKAITELFTQICRGDECWLNRLGWKKLSTRDRCNLFSSAAFLLKQGRWVDLTRSLHRQVNRSWLEKQFNAALQRLSCGTGRRDPDHCLRDLRASLRAMYFWLEGRFFLIAEAREHTQLIFCFATITENLLETMSRLDLQPSKLLYSVWHAAAHWSFYFRRHMPDLLGFDRTVILFDGLLQKLQHWTQLRGLTFELRLTLLGNVLMKCEDLLHKRNKALSRNAWSQCEDMLKSNLAKCNEFMGRYEPPFTTDDPLAHARQKLNARLDLLLKESAFNRLECAIYRAARQRIQQYLHKYRVASDEWSAQSSHREIGTIELAKWYFLAGENETGVKTLMGLRCDSGRLSLKKAVLLAQHNMFQAAVDEFLGSKALMTDHDQRKRDQVDDQIAMTKLQWYQAENNIEHLISAYRLSVDLLRRCNSGDRLRFEGGLVHIVNAMKNSGMRFEDYVGVTSVLGYLVRDGCGIKSWQHLADLLYIRHKMSLTSVDSVNKLADKVGDHRLYLGIGKKT